MILSPIVPKRGTCSHCSFPYGHRSMRLKEMGWWMWHKTIIVTTTPTYARWRQRVSVTDIPCLCEWKKTFNTTGLRYQVLFISKNSDNHLSGTAFCHLASKICNSRLFPIVMVICKTQLPFIKYYAHPLNIKKHIISYHYKIAYTL